MKPLMWQRVCVCVCIHACVCELMSACVHDNIICKFVKVMKLWNETNF